MGKQPKDCGCGCGGTTKGGEFLPGHDAVLKSRLIDAASGPDSADALAELLKRGWLQATKSQLATGLRIAYVAMVGAVDDEGVPFYSPDAAMEEMRSLLGYERVPSVEGLSAINEAIIDSVTYDDGAEEETVEEETTDEDDPVEEDDTEKGPEAEETEPATTIRFSAKGPYPEFSPDTVRPFVLNDQRWSTILHYLAASMSDDPDYQQEIRECSNIGWVKRKMVTEPDENWDERGELYNATFASFETDGGLVVALKATMPSSLSWQGDFLDLGKGRNLYGEVLAQVRFDMSIPF